MPARVGEVKVTMSFVPATEPLVVIITSPISSYSTVSFASLWSPSMCASIVVPVEDPAVEPTAVTVTTLGSPGGALLDARSAVDADTLTAWRPIFGTLYKFRFSSPFAGGIPEVSTADPDPTVEDKGVTPSTLWCAVPDIDTRADTPAWSSGESTPVPTASPALSPALSTVATKLHKSSSKVPTSALPAESTPASTTFM